MEDISKTQPTESTKLSAYGLTETEEAVQCLLRVHWVLCIYVWPLAWCFVGVAMFLTLLSALGTLSPVVLPYLVWI